MKSEEWDKREKDLDKMLNPPDHIKKLMTEQLMQAELIIRKQHHYHEEFYVQGSLHGIVSIRCNECSWKWKKSWWRFW